MSSPRRVGLCNSGSAAWLLLLVLVVMVGMGAVQRQDDVEPPPAGQLYDHRRQRRPTIVMCTSELEHLTAGGAGVVVADISRALAAAGWRVVIVVDLEEAVDGHEKLRLALDSWLAQAKRAWVAAATAVAATGKDEKRHEIQLETLSQLLLSEEAGVQVHDGHVDDRIIILASSSTSVLRQQNHHQPQHQQPRQATTPAASSLPLILRRKSQQWSRALAQLEARMAIDAIEFCDHGAPAYNTLLDRRRQQDSRAQDDRPAIWIRTHGLHQAILESNTTGAALATATADESSSSNARDAHLDVTFRMETRALQMADAVVANTLGIAREYQRLHALDPARIVVISPTLGTLPSNNRRQLESNDAHHNGGQGTMGLDGAATIIASAASAAVSPRNSQSPQPRATIGQNVLVYGKLQRVKGVDLAAKALVQVMRDLGEAWQGTVIFAGDDMPCDTNSRPSTANTNIINKNMSACILAEAQVPAALSGRFRFAGRIGRGTLGQFASAHSIRAVVLPSRYETFCLAAHEAAHYGLAAVLPNLPAYQGVFQDGDTALLFRPGSVDDLARVIKCAILDDALTSKIARGAAHLFTLARYPDPAAGYARLLSLMVSGTASGEESL
jgi:glycosyltransferase involved in cell wall biosynthesis